MLRRPDSIPASDTIIEDPAIEPFFITVPQAGGYVVYERVTKGENKNEYLKTIGYPSNFNYALKMISRELVNAENGKHYTSLLSYIDKWEKIQEKLNNLTPIDV